MAAAHDQRSAIVPLPAARFKKLFVYLSRIATQNNHALEIIEYLGEPPMIAVSHFMHVALFNGGLKILTILIAKAYFKR